MSRLNSFTAFLAICFQGTRFLWNRQDGPLVGLSTDLYFPPLEDLLSSFSGTSFPEYIELFRGRTEDLSRARTSVPADFPLTYHGDCLWYTQADFPLNPAFLEEILRANRHMDALHSPWIIHECAQKTMEGYAFGFYAPPLLTREGAIAARKGALFLETSLNGRLLLVETPPFPPHPTGPLDLSDFFHIVTRETTLGIGLDIGHCLTYLSVSGRKAAPDELLGWLQSFPLERVVEIHMGGLSLASVGKGACLIDDHSRDIPDLLFDSLEAVCRDLPLPNLKGVALEVDNKEIPLILREYSRFREIILRSFKRGPEEHPLPFPSFDPLTPIDQKCTEDEAPPDLLSSVALGYRRLAQDLTGSENSSYSAYLYPDEIWNFGGSIPDLFPDTISLLADEGFCPRDSFVEFFNRHPRSPTEPYDYLKIKIQRTLEWVDSLSQSLSSPELLRRIQSNVRREADLLIRAQEQYNGDPL